MTNKLCHLCGTHYNDDPFFRIKPAQTWKHCLEILQYRYNKVQLEADDVGRQLARAKLEYVKGAK